jgi:L-ascorbate metabolism protein UlaG (beta-lactamase superfamily)
VADPNLRLRRDVRIEPRYAGHQVDCRLLYMGDRYRQLLRVYPEVIRRLTRNPSPESTLRDLQESPEILHYYHVEQRADAIGVVMRDEMFRTEAPLDGVTFELLVWDNRRHERFDLPLDRFCTLGLLLPLLGGDRSAAAVATEIRGRLNDSALGWAEALLSRLRAGGFIEEVAAPVHNEFLRSPARPRVTLVSHTSLLVQSTTSSILLDPLLRTGNAVHEHARDVMRLKLDAICCSHSHWDHCDVASLLLLDKRTPIIIPRLRRATVFNPPIASMLRRIGFEDIREANLWEPLRIGDIEIIPVPFHGEQDEPGAEIDHYTYVLRTADWCLYGGVDAFRDTDGDMIADLERIAREYRPSIAFLPVSRMIYAYATGGVNGFCREVNTRTVREEFQYTADPDLAVDWARTLGATLVVPYATFAFERTMADPEVWRFAAAMDHAGLGDRVLLLRPIDAIEPSDLAGGPSALRRRRFLRRWIWAAARLTQADRRYSRRFPYRILKRLWHVSRPPEPVPLGWVNS